VLRIAAEALVALLLFGCIPVVVRTISANPYTIGIFRLAVATTVVAAVLAGRGSLRRLPPRDLGRLAIIGVLFFAHWMTLFFAIKASSASIAAIGQSTYGVHLLILAALFVDHRARRTDIVAVILAVMGAILVVPRFTFGNGIAVGMLLATVSAFFYATLPLLHQRWSHIPTPLRTLGQFGFALLCFTFFIHKTVWTLAARDWAGLLFLAVAVTLVAHTLWVRVTTQLAPSLTSIIYYGQIPVAIALGVLLLDEPLAPRTIVGALLIIAGSVLGLASRARQSHVAPHSLQRQRPEIRK
jgi:drug/metabolite transporter (DMT)-like permease